MPPRPSLPRIFLVALRLGCTSFGGPVAHLAFFRREYVGKLGWLDEAHFADLVALCQFLPGPASSQTGFGVGYLKRGLAGGLVAWLGFTLPSALLMIGFALGVTAVGDISTAGWLRGLKVAAVAVVAQAVWAMSVSLCPDWPRRVLALGATVVVLRLPTAWSQIAVIAAGAALGWMWFKPGSARSTAAGGSLPDPATNTGPAGTGEVSREGASFTQGICWLVLFLALLLGLPWVAHATGNPWLEIFDRFYRAGALVFGGGHVVLPLLEREVVAPGWVTHDQFLAGYGAAQAVPGPLFTFSAYLGTLIRPGPGHLMPAGPVGPVAGLRAGWPAGVWALLAIFLPALLLVAGALPFWQALRHRPGAQAALRGANAAVVGLLLAALLNPVGPAGLTNGRSFALAVAGFVALLSGRVAAWVVVVAAAALGAVLLYLAGNRHLPPPHDAFCCVTPHAARIVPRSPAAAEPAGRRHRWPRFEQDPFAG